ncbi:hypothetical protein NXV47_18480 [Bacteroides uniformis]|nr:hypothetical protein [Bacteroides uniformis]
MRRTTIHIFAAIALLFIRLPPADEKGLRSSFSKSAQATKKC